MAKAASGRIRLLVALALMVVLVSAPVRALAAPGDLDASFGSGGTVLNSSLGLGSALAVQPDGKIVIGGFSNSGPLTFAIARYTPAGNLDTGFGGGDGLATGDFAGFARALTLQSDGRIVATGMNEGLVTTVRYNADGTVDTNFGGGDGVVTTDLGGEEDEADALAIQPDGKIVVSGTAVLRYNPDGSVDTSFGGGDGVATAFGGRDLALLPNGKLVVAATDGDFLVGRYNADGTVDTSFGGGDGQATADFSSSASAEAIAVQADGKLVLAGYTGDQIALARFNADGSLDSSFGSDGKVTNAFGLDDRANDLVVQPNGKLVVVGEILPALNENLYDFGIVRYNPDGSVDTSFGGGDGWTTLNFGSQDSARAVALQADGKTIISGTALAGIAIARLEGDVPPLVEQPGETPGESDRPSAPAATSFGSMASATSHQTRHRRPRKCRKGFRKRRLHGKARCVKVKKQPRR